MKKTYIFVVSVIISSLVYSAVVLPDYIINNPSNNTLSIDEGRQLELIRNMLSPAVLEAIFGLYANLNRLDIKQGELLPVTKINRAANNPDIQSFMAVLPESIFLKKSGASLYVYTGRYVLRLISGPNAEDANLAETLENSVQSTPVEQMGEGRFVQVFLLKKPLNIMDTSSKAKIKEDFLAGWRNDFPVHDYNAWLLNAPVLGMFIDFLNSCDSAGICDDRKLELVIQGNKVVINFPRDGTMIEIILPDGGMLKFYILGYRMEEINNKSIPIPYLSFNSNRYIYNRDIREMTATVRICPVSSAPFNWIEVVQMPQGLASVIGKEPLLTIERDSKQLEAGYPFSVLMETVDERPLSTHPCGISRTGILLHHGFPVIYNGAMVRLLGCGPAQGILKTDGTANLNIFARRGLLNIEGGFRTDEAEEILHRDERFPSEFERLAVWWKAALPLDDEKIPYYTGISLVTDTFRLSMQKSDINSFPPIGNEFFARESGRLFVRHLVSNFVRLYTPHRQNYTPVIVDNNVLSLEYMDRGEFTEIGKGWQINLIWLEKEGYEDIKKSLTVLIDVLWGMSAQDMEKFMALIFSFISGMEGCGADASFIRQMRGAVADSKTDDPKKLRRLLCDKWSDCIWKDIVISKLIQRRIENAEELPVFINACREWLTEINDWPTWFASDGNGRVIDDIAIEAKIRQLKFPEAQFQGLYLGRFIDKKREELNPLERIALSMYVFYAKTPRSWIKARRAIQIFQYIQRSGLGRNISVGEREAESADALLNYLLKELFIKSLSGEISFVDSMPELEEDAGKRFEKWKCACAGTISNLSNLSTHFNLDSALTYLKEQWFELFIPARSELIKRYEEFMSFLSGLSGFSLDEMESRIREIESYVISQKDPLKAFASLPPCVRNAYCMLMAEAYKRYGARLFESSRFLELDRSYVLYKGHAYFEDPVKKVLAYLIDGDTRIKVKLPRGGKEIFLDKGGDFNFATVAVAITDFLILNGIDAEDIDKTPIKNGPRYIVTAPVKDNRDRSADKFKHAMGNNFWPYQPSAQIDMVSFLKTFGVNARFFDLSSGIDKLEDLLKGIDETTVIGVGFTAPIKPGSVRTVKEIAAYCHQKFGTYGPIITSGGIAAEGNNYLLDYWVVKKEGKYVVTKSVPASDMVNARPMIDAIHRTYSETNTLGLVFSHWMKPEIDPVLRVPGALMQVPNLWILNRSGELDTHSKTITKTVHTTTRSLRRTIAALCLRDYSVYRYQKAWDRKIMERPARHPRNRYFHRRTVDFITEHGDCSTGCDFCSYTKLCTMHKKIPVRLVIRNLLRAKRALPDFDYGMMIDGNLLSNLAWAKEFFDEVSKSPELADVQFFIQAPFYSIRDNEKLAGRIKRANVDILCIGQEGATEQFLVDIGKLNKRSLYPFFKGITRFLHRMKIPHPRTSWILFHPKKTQEEVIATMERVMEQIEEGTITFVSYYVEAKPKSLLMTDADERKKADKFLASIEFKDSEDDEGVILHQVILPYDPVLGAVSIEALEHFKNALQGLKEKEKRDLPEAVEILLAFKIILEKLISRNGCSIPDDKLVTLLKRCKCLLNAALSDQKPSGQPFDWPLDATAMPFTAYNKIRIMQSWDVSGAAQNQQKIDFLKACLNDDNENVRESARLLLSHIPAQSDITDGIAGKMNEIERIVPAAGMTQEQFEIEKAA